MATNPEEEPDTHVSEGPVAVVVRTVRETVIESPRSWRLVEALVIVATAVLFTTLASPWNIVGVVVSTMLALTVSHRRR